MNNQLNNKTKKLKKMQYRTDMALEFGLEISSDFEDDVVKKTSVVVSKEISKRINKPEGRYVTVETASVVKGDKHEYNRVSIALANALKDMQLSNNTLIVALGNPDMTADSLGKRVLSHTMITRHMNALDNMPILSGIYPNVLGVTGIESFDIIKGVSTRTKPESILVIDSLAGATVGRIASAFQISDAGITPGSGISNHRTRLDKKSLGVPVISIGVPLVVYASTIINDAVGAVEKEYDNTIANMVVTPKDIDIFVSDCANIISRAINLAFFDTDFDGLL